MTSRTADGVIVGAGVVGASAAFHLASLGAKRVVVCERRRPAAGASGRSGAFIQLHFCQNESEARLTLAALPYFVSWDDFVGSGACGFVPAGYLRLEGSAQSSTLRVYLDMLRSIGVNTSVIGVDEVRRAAPYLRTDDVAVAAYEPASGCADPQATVDGFLSAAASLGVEVWTDTEAVEICHGGGRVTGVETTRGHIATPTVVLAAGVWTRTLVDPLELVLPIVGARTQSAAFRWSTERAQPVVNVGDGIRFVYFHAMGARYQDLMVGLSGGARRPVRDADLYDAMLDNHYAAACLDRLVWRLPGAVGARLIGGASGPITLTPDNLPIIDRYPAIEGVYLFAGDSGSSFKTAPAVGRVLPEWAVLGSPRLVDVSAFGISRFKSAGGAVTETETEYHRIMHMKSFTVRRAQPSDLQQARALMLRTFELDFGYGYRPDYHADVDDLRGVYLDNPRHVLMVAVDDDSGAVIGTAGIHSRGLKAAFNPAWLVACYEPERAAQIVRVYVAREQRRRGIAQALVKAVCQFVADEGSYSHITLHTDPRSPGAERFWTSQPTTLVFDDRDGPSGSIHFEMEIPTPSVGSAQAVRRS